jgi:hypothetical protein
MLTVLVAGSLSIALGFGGIAYALSILWPLPPREQRPRATSGTFRARPVDDDAARFDSSWRA